MNSQFIYTIKEHILLITTNFSKSNHTWDERSVWAGYSAFAYLIPVFFIKDTNKYTTIFKFLWILQTILVFTSDYILANRKDYLIRGFDRLLATSMVLTMIIITYKYYNIWYTIIGGFFPVYFVYNSKIAARNQDWDSYVINHTLWHISGGVIASYFLYKIQLNNKLFVT